MRVGKRKIEKQCKKVGSCHSMDFYSPQRNEILIESCLTLFFNKGPIQSWLSMFLLSKFPKVTYCALIVTVNE